MRKARTQELRLIVEQANAWLLMPQHCMEQEERLNWLMKSPLQLREILVAMSWNDEIGSALDPDRRIDMQRLVATTTNNVIPLPRGYRA